MSNLSDNSYRLQLNNRLQHLGLPTFTHEIRTCGPKHDETHTCTIFIQGSQCGQTMPGKTKKTALEAAARSAFQELQARYPPA